MLPDRPRVKWRSGQPWICHLFSGVYLAQASKRLVFQLLKQWYTRRTKKTGCFIGNKLGDMKVDHYEKSAQNRVDMPGATGCKVRKLIGAEEQAPNFAMRQFEVEPGGFTPRHCHPYEHEVFVLEGTGVVFEGDQQHPIRPGDVIYVAPNEIHQFRNPGENSLKFLCLIPNSASNQKVTPVPECGEI